HAGNLAHALYLYEENVRVPFFIAAPGAPLEPRRAPQLASLVDLAPTTLALAALPGEPAQEGRSLLAVSAPRVARFFTEQGARRAGLRDGRWKVIVDADVGRTEVYDLATDPGERDGPSADAARIANAYRFCLGLR